MPVDAAQPVSTPRRTPCTQQFAQSTHPTSAASSSFEHLLLLPPFSLCTHITSILPSPPPPTAPSNAIAQRRRPRAEVAQRRRASDELESRQARW
ncbi:hypothetical protein ACFX1X_005002 [Malus domestica]